MGARGHLGRVGTNCTVRCGTVSGAVEDLETCVSLGPRSAWYGECSSVSMSVQPIVSAPISTDTERSQMRRCWVVAPVVSEIEGMAPPPPPSGPRVTERFQTTAPSVPAEPYDGVVRRPAILLSSERAEALRLALAERAR